MPGGQCCGTGGKCQGKSCACKNCKCDSSCPCYEVKQAQQRRGSISSPSVSDSNQISVQKKK